MRHYPAPVARRQAAGFSAARGSRRARGACSPRILLRGAQKLIAAVLDCGKPVVAEVQGTAAGLGAHLAFACDLVVASESAKFIESFVLRGLVVDAAGAYLLPRRIGLQRAKELADARRFIDLASALEAPYVRVFGGKAESDKSPMPSDETKARVAAGLRELGTYAGPLKVTVIIESHDHFTSSATLKDVLRAAGSENVGLLWDAHHTFATSNEDPKYTVHELGTWIRHTHIKDSIGSGEDRKYVLTGRGNVPIARQIEALRSIQYKGFYCFEWEKLWHPDIDDPEIAIADYARVVGQCLGNAQACGVS